jgi:FAD:protein FMN transferase
MTSCSKMSDLVRRCRPLLGTLVEITADDPAAVDEAFVAIERVHGLMSAHEPTSDISMINSRAHNEEVAVHPLTAAVLARSLHWTAQSGGMFDIVMAGRAALASGLLPLHPGQALPDPDSNSSDLELRGCTVRLRRPACLDVGGIAKGFAVDQAVEALRSAGASLGLVNAGGDMRGFGPESWCVAIANPRTRRPALEVELCNAALATSAAQRQESGLSLAHLPNARRDRLSVTVHATDAIDADALTKIVLAGPKSTSACLDSVHARALTIDGSGRVENIA